MKNPRPIERDAESPDQAAAACGLCRSMIYQAMNPDPAKRKGLPFLPSFKIGVSRRIRTETRRKWLADLEAAAIAESEAA
jgi:hypothetical protein